MTADYNVSLHSRFNALRIALTSYKLQAPNILVHTACLLLRHLQP